MSTFTITGPAIAVLAGYTQFTILCTDVGNPATVPPQHTEMALAHPLYQAGNPAGYPAGQFAFRAFYRTYSVDGDSTDFTFSAGASCFYVGYTYTLSGVRSVPVYVPGTQRVSSTTVQSASFPARLNSVVVYALWGAAWSDSSLDSLFSPATLVPAGAGPNLLRSYYEVLSSAATIQRGGAGVTTYTEQEVDAFEFRTPNHAQQMVI